MFDGMTYDTYVCVLQSSCENELSCHQISKFMSNLCCSFLVERL